MDIERISMDMASANAIRSFGMGMMRRSMDQVEQIGVQIVEMIQDMPTVSVSQTSLTSKSLASNNSTVSFLA